MDIQIRQKDDVEDVWWEKNLNMIYLMPSNEVFIVFDYFIREQLLF